LTFIFSFFLPRKKHQKRSDVALVLGESLISTETWVKFQQNKTNDDNTNNTNVNNNKKSNNQPLANVDRATSRVGLQFSFVLIEQLNYY
jgi:uncharacterized protein YycO